MNHFFSKVRQNYGDMKLASKLTLVLMITVTVPVIMMACFFYGKLYDMVVSYTIRQEQDISAKQHLSLKILYSRSLMPTTGSPTRIFFRLCFTSL